MSTYSAGRFVGKTYDNKLALCIEQKASNGTEVEVMLWLRAEELPDLEYVLQRLRAALAAR